MFCSLARDALRAERLLVGYCHAFSAHTFHRDGFPWVALMIPAAGLGCYSARPAQRHFSVGAKRPLTGWSLAPFRARMTASPSAAFHSIGAPWSLMPHALGLSKSR